MEVLKIEYFHLFFALNRLWDQTASDPLVLYIGKYLNGLLGTIEQTVTVKVG
jgi:hypothetical protein